MNGGAGMDIENEGRVLNINPKQVLESLKKINAEFRHASFQKRYVYDFNPVIKGKWIRLRSNGKINTLAIKEITNTEISGTRELEIEVSDFEKTNEILCELGYMPRAYQENFRIEFTGEDYSVDIDYWPQLGIYLEVEANTSERVFQIFSFLGFKQEDVTGENVDLLYQREGINLDRIKYLKFSDEEEMHIKEIAKGLQTDGQKK